MLAGPLIAQALTKAIDFLGEESASLLVQDLAFLGVNLNDPQLNLEQISKALFEVFGDQAASLIFEMFMQELARLDSPSSIKG